MMLNIDQLRIFKLMETTMLTNHHKDRKIYLLICVMDSLSIHEQGYFKSSDRATKSSKILYKVLEENRELH